MAKANYGLDAPDVVGRFFGIGTGLIGAGLVSLAWVKFLAAPLCSMGATSFLTGGLMVWGSKVGKLRVRDKMIDGLDLRGDEHVLDVGCGHGLMLIGAAKRLRSGKAVGIDLWQAEDQAGNSREATRQNAEAEGVAERVELVDGDARRMPFADGSFDAVVSSWALHNIYDAPGRGQALQEVARVLKPGGRLALMDIRHGAEYGEMLRKLDFERVQRQGPNFVFVIPSSLVTARKKLKA